MRLGRFERLFDSFQDELLQSSKPPAAGLEGLAQSDDPIATKVRSARSVEGQFRGEA
jgi:hypothetical protein